MATEDRAAGAVFAFWGWIPGFAGGLRGPLGIGGLGYESAKSQKIIGPFPARVGYTKVVSVACPLSYGG
jgi:hypothetical protein